MDVIEASHFEVIKQYLKKDEGSTFKAVCNAGTWNLYIVDSWGAILTDIFAPTFGAAIRELSRAIQERETEEVSIRKTSGSGKTMVATLRNLGTGEEISIERERDPYDLKDTYGGVLPE